MSIFLLNFSNTLQYLELIEIEWVLQGEVRYKLVLPLLPKLKTFVVNKLYVWQLTAENIIINAPNLEKCNLIVWERYPNKSLNTFFEGQSIISNKKLSDFRLMGENIHFSGEQECQILNWFPNMKRMEVGGIRDANEGILDLLRQVGTSQVEHFKLGWSKPANICTREDIIVDTALIRQTCYLESK